MPKVTVLQTDDRESVDYMLLTRQVNEKICKKFGFNYIFIKNRR